MSCILSARRSEGPRCGPSPRGAFADYYYLIIDYNLYILVIDYNIIDYNL